MNTWIIYLDIYPSIIHHRYEVQFLKLHLTHGHPTVVKMALPRTRWSKSTLNSVLWCGLVTWPFTVCRSWMLLAGDLIGLWYLNGYGSIPIHTIFRGWTSIYQLFWCSPGVQGFDTLPNDPLPGLGNVYSELGNGPDEIVDLPINNGGFP